MKANNMKANTRINLAGEFDLFRMFALLSLIVIAIALFVLPGVTAVNELGTPTINVTLKSQSPDPVEQDKTTELKFPIRNRGKVAAKDVVVQIVPEFPLSVFGKETESIGDLG